MASAGGLRWIIGGGTGFIGSNLKKSLLKQGHEVTIISRNPKQEDEIHWDDLTARSYDGYFDVVVNFAGKPILHRNMFLDYPSHLKAVYKSRIESNEKLRNWIHSLSDPPDLFFSASGIGFISLSYSQFPRE